MFKLCTMGERFLVVLPDDHVGFVTYHEIRKFQEEINARFPVTEEERFVRSEKGLAYRLARRLEESRYELTTRDREDIKEALALGEER